MLVKADLIIMAIESRSIKTTKYIQSCITSVSFPETIGEVLNMVKRNKSIAGWSTDLDVLLNFDKANPVFWTAPPWLKQGDIVFFYHAKRASFRTAKLLAEARGKLPSKRNLINLMKRAKHTADLYSGNLFACALAAGSTRLFEKQEKHFISRLYAPLGEVHVFENPLPQELFTEWVKIGLSTITPLYNREFKGIRRLLSKQNEIPGFLQRTALGDDTFKNVNANNWRSISCLPETKFNYEGQLRAYLLDFFLNELKDKNSPLLEECDCFLGNHKTGRADYFIRVFGQWIPIEAKLRISKEKNIVRQTAKYMNINSFSPRKGSYRNKIFNVKPIPVCLVIDQLGLYFISAIGDEFVNGVESKPLWRREDFSQDVCQQIREQVKIF